MYSKKVLQLKNIAFFKPTTRVSGNHSSSNSHKGMNRNNHHNNYNHRQASSDIRGINSSYVQTYIQSQSQAQMQAQEKKNTMLFPTVSERVNTAGNLQQTSPLTSSSSSNHKISLHKHNNSSGGVIDNKTFKSNLRLSNEYTKENRTEITSGPSGQLYQELSKQLNNSHRNANANGRQLRIMNDVSMSMSMSQEMNNNNKGKTRKNNHHPSSLKSTSASKESNTCRNSIKIGTSKGYGSNSHNNSNCYNNVEDINTPEELHYFYVNTLQSGKLAENKF